MLEIALQYSRRGWAVLPMRGKRLPRGPIQANATIDPAVIVRSHWLGIGMACGAPAATDVLDIDDGETCPLDREALIASTLAASTPSGGVHLFFAYAGFPTRRFAWGEWRSTGVAVALPPGDRRAWLNDLPVTAAPEELVCMLKPRVGQQKEYASGPSHHSFSGPLVGELPKPIYLAIVRSKPPNGHEQRRVMGIIRTLIQCRSHRNDCLNWAAYELRRFEWLPRDVTAALLEDSSKLNGYMEKDGAAAVQATIRSGLGT